LKLDIFGSSGLKRAKIGQINFSIFDNDAVNANAVGEWVLYLKMTGIKE
jgi:hypothetical protein